MFWTHLWNRRTLSCSDWPSRTWTGHRWIWLAVLSSVNASRTINLIHVYQCTWLFLCWWFSREAGGPSGSESPCSCRQLSAGLGAQWVLEGASSVHPQRLQVSTHTTRLIQVFPCLWRHIPLCLSSAILYLNDDFEGGDLIFTEMDAKVVTVHLLLFFHSLPLPACPGVRLCLLWPPQAEVRPHCGRVVGFGAGKENPHGVRAVTKGQRCAVALWFTLDPAHEEKVGTFHVHWLKKVHSW